MRVSIFEESLLRAHFFAEGVNLTHAGVRRIAERVGFVILGYEFRKEARHGAITLKKQDCPILVRTIFCKLPVQVLTNEMKAALIHVDVFDACETEGSSERI